MEGLEFTIAEVTIVGTSPYSQSREHREPELKGESKDDYDIRTWKLKTNLHAEDLVKHKVTNEDIINGGGLDCRVVIPSHGMHQAIAAAARYSKRQIPGQGKATWTAKFTSGISIMESPILNVTLGGIDGITISANSDGVRGSGKRVPRRFPVVNRGWKSTFEVVILDPIITQDVFTEMMKLAGLFIGVGRFRPEKGGHNGRFNVSNIVWNEADRRLAA